MILYADKQFTSPYVMSAYVALKEKELPFHVQLVDLALDENAQEPFSGISLTRRVPVLVHGELRLAESTAIEEYLEEQFPEPAHRSVFPKNRNDRAIARQVQAWLRSDLMALREERSTKSIFFRERAGKPLTDRAVKAARKLVASASELISDEQENMFGDWSIADTDMAVMLHRVIEDEGVLPPHLKYYAERQFERPSVQQWLALPRGVYGHA